VDVPKGMSGKKVAMFVGAFFVGLVLSRLAGYLLNQAGIPAAAGTTWAGIKLPQLRKAA